MNLLRPVCLLAFGVFYCGAFAQVGTLVESSTQKESAEKDTVTPHPSPLLKEEREQTARSAKSNHKKTSSLSPGTGVAKQRSERAGVRGRSLTPTTSIGQPASSSPILQRYDFSGPGMATTFRISCYAESRDLAEKATTACFARIAELNQIFTDYDPTSELMRLCAPNAQYPMSVSPPLLDILKQALTLAEITHGAFDPTCGHLSQLWRRTKRRGKLPPAERLQAGISATDWHRVQLDVPNQRVTLRPGTLLDLGGIAKGYAADECLRLLRQHGLPRAVVQAGGDTAVGEAPPGQSGWEIKLRTFTRPGDEDELTTLVLANRAVSTSGDLYQFIEIDGIRYSHILSPKTGLGLTKSIACSVIAPNCTTSDALATAMCVMGVEAGTQLAKTLPDVEVRFAVEK